MKTPSDQLAIIDAKFAVSTKDLSDAVARIGTSTVDAQVSFAELLAIITSVQQTTSRGGTVIGNAIQTILARLRRPMVIEALSTIGIRSDNVISLLKEYAFVRESLSSAKRTEIDTLIAGRFQLNVLKALLVDLHKRRSTYTVVLKAITS